MINEAMSVLDELKKRKIKVPKDICVSGFDNILEAYMNEPSLTTIEVPSDELATKSIDVLLDKLEGKEVPNTICVPGKSYYRQSCGCNKKNNIDKKLYISEIEKYRGISLICNYMGVDFESIITMKDWIEWSGKYISGLEVNRAFVCLKERMSDNDDLPLSSPRTPLMYLRLAMTKPGQCEEVEIKFNSRNYLPDEYMHMLDEGVNLVIPLHSKEEVFGYFIFQLGDDSLEFINAETEFLCMNMGNALKRLYTYQDIFSLNDVKRLYLRDPLTNIYNRRGFDNKFSDVKEVAYKLKHNIYIVCLDMDGLKYINDNFGHAAGDDAILVISKCLSLAIDRQEVCARVGGDEFRAALIIDRDDRKERFINDFKRYLAEENKNINEDFEVDASIGFCEMMATDSLEKALLKADEMMYDNKRNKKQTKGDVR